MCAFPFTPPPRGATSDRRAERELRSKQIKHNAAVAPNPLQVGASSGRRPAAAAASYQPAQRRRWTSVSVAADNTPARELRLGNRRSLDRLWQNGSKHHRSEESGGPGGEERQRRSVKERTSILQEPETQKQIKARRLKPS